MRTAKSIFQNGLRHFGYDLRRIRVPDATSGLPQELVQPRATYAPWAADADFDSVYSLVRANTLLDVYRAYELWQLVAQVRAVPGALVEVGVWRGGSGALIGARAKQCGISRPVYLCDTFAGVVKATELDSAYVGGEHS
jgi:O-methyltransferase